MRLVAFFNSLVRSSRLLIALLIMVALGLGARPGGADLADDLEELRQRQAEVQEQRKGAAAEVDVATAEASELAAALEVATAEVNEQATKVAAAERALVAANDRHDAAVLAVIAQEAAIEDLEDRLSHQAISSFVNQTSPQAGIFDDHDPNRAVRMRSLAQVVADDGITVTDDLRVAKEDLEIERRTAADATEEAARIQETMAEDLAELERRRTVQEELWAAADERLDRSLSEAAALAELDGELAAEIVKTNEELARQSAARRDDRNNPAPRSNTVGFPSADDIVNVKGFWVHRDIEDNFRAMLEHAERDGIRFTGGAYRDHSSQIRLRKAHCGTSNYAIYQMPASRCRPPTARPGASMHEQGKAIDFQYNGRIIGTRNNAGFRWLNANAAAYGFYNLASEPWHWSTNGR